MARSDSAALFLQRFAENVYATQRPENVSPTTIYRIPSSLRDLDPNAYEPRVVSIGPYHYGKEKLQAMEWHKHRALNCFLGRNNGIKLEDILAEFEREPGFLLEVRNCYTEPLEPKWSDDDVFFRLMALDGCFLLELLLGNYTIPDPTSINDRPEKHALLSYVKMDMLVLDNQIPLLILRKLASIIANLVSNRPSASQPTGSVDVAIPIENLNINQRIWKFYGNMNDGIPANDAHHVLDAYREGCIGTGSYDGWASRWSARELYYHRVKFLPSSGGGVADGFVAMGSFTDVEFKVLDNIWIKLHDCFFYSELPGQAEPSDQSQNGQEQQNHQNNRNGQAQSRILRTLLPLITAAFWWIIRFSFLFLTIWWWYDMFFATKGMLSLPRLTIDGTTRPILLNLMAFERLHLQYKKTHPVTDYASLMASLIRSEIDVEHLRNKSILSCSPGWTDESVVKLFADLTRDVVFNGTGKTNSQIDALCDRQANRVSLFVRRITSSETSDEKTRSVVLLTFYGLGYTIFNIFNILRK